MLDGEAHLIGRGWETEQVPVARPKPHRSTMTTRYPAATNRGARAFAHPHMPLVLVWWSNTRAVLPSPLDAAGIRMPSAVRATSSHASGTPHQPLMLLVKPSGTVPVADGVGVGSAVPVLTLGVAGVAVAGAEVAGVAEGGAGGVPVSVHAASRTAAARPAMYVNFDMPVR